ncbi:DUF504 domain-containing protein [Noviherbaspirillum sp.]|uniref:DUF504 domain-containing protein n=1 Tax=Noviherbaspirillum sp. TaxID=1926288 RepID=UPI002B473DE9|nr:DUF504 domain-containing protein [Noviherbaspirillum sp.]HJV79853.1 DUF504 domain-containing protein [Noviherbaspirillum sp.]
MHIALPHSISTSVATALELHHCCIMIPIQDLLHRIQWDAEFGKGSFMIGYYDRVDDNIVRVPFREVFLAPGQNFSFDVMGEDGVTHMVPFHRVREMWRNGDLIWQRKLP